MRRVFLLSLLLVLLVIAGCNEWYLAVGDPNSGLNRTMDATTDIADAVAVGATASGTPIGLLIGMIATGISAIGGIYNNYRKNIVIRGKDARLHNNIVTTKAIVDAIESVSELHVGSSTLGKVVKSEVKKKLLDEEAYRIGKAVIDSLK